jgi:hypothetical protein
MMGQSKLLSFAYDQQETKSGALDRFNKARGSSGPLPPWRLCCVLEISSRGLLYASRMASQNLIPEALRIEGERGSARYLTTRPGHGAVVGTGHKAIGSGL